MPSLPNAAPTAHSATTRAFVQWIRLAAPYIHAFRGKTFVIAFGGEMTSYRLQAETIVDALASFYDKAVPWTAAAPLPGCRDGPACRCWWC